MASPLKRGLLGLLEIVYGLYAATAFLVCGLLAFALVVLRWGSQHGAHWRTSRRRPFSDLPACRCA
jgi:hypothetical protein